MRNVRFIFAALCAALLLAGCGKRQLSPNDVETPEPDPVEQESGLPGAPQEQNACRITAVSPASPFSVISLSEGGVFWIVFRDASILDGAYVFSDGVYSLDGFGTVYFLGKEGTKAGDERSETVVVNELDGDEYTVDCTVYENRDPSVLYRSWKVTKTYVSVGEESNLEFNGLNLGTLASRLQLCGIPVGEMPSLSVKSVDISGTGDFTVTFNDKGKSVKASWSGMEENLFFIDWKDEEVDLEFMKRSGSAQPLEIDYGFDMTEDVLGLGFMVSTKNSSAKPVDLGFLVLLEPMADEAK